MDFKKEIAKSVEHATGKNVENLLEVPPDPKLGDFALPCFQLSQILKKNPNEIASELSRKISSPYIEKIEAKGPYLNIFINKNKLAEITIKKIFKEGKKYGRQKQNQRIMLEFPSPNTNKPLHLGHVRNIALGQSLARILDHAGNKTIITNLNNDRGIHICQAMLAYSKWGNNKKPNKKSDHFVGDFYVIYHKHENDKLVRESQELLQKWEEKGKSTRKLWKMMNSWAIRGFAETYKKFNLTFRKTYNESQIYEKARSIVQEGISKNVFHKEPDKSIAANLDAFGLGKKVVLRSDGTSVYITQDLWLAKQKFQDFKIDRSIYIVGSEQIHHFRVLFLLLELLGYEFAKKCHHFSYGMVYLPEGRMKSREGKVIDADDLVQEMEKLAEKELKKRYKLSAAELKKRREAIAMSAIRFYLLKFEPARDIYFNPEESISFEGETGPYIQYAYARIRSILRRYGKKVSPSTDFSVYGDKENSLIKILAEFPTAVEDTSKNLRPSSITHYALKLAQEFNNFYTSCPVLQAEEKVKKARLALITAVAIVLRKALSLLHINALEEM